MKKKIISLICAMIILLLIFGVFICKSRIKNKNNSDDNTSIETSNNKENDNTNDNDNYNNKKNTDDSNQNNVNKNKEKSKDEQKSNNKTDNNNPKTNTKESNKNKTQTITYSCPSGYSLNGKKCISVINANYKCPENTTDYSNEGIPSNTYCVNLNTFLMSLVSFCSLLTWLLENLKLDM